MDPFQVETRDQTVDRVLNSYLKGEYNPYISGRGLDYSEVSTWLITNHKTVMDSKLLDDNASNFFIAYDFFIGSLSKEITLLEERLRQIHNIKEKLEQKKKQQEEKQQEEKNLTSGGGFRQSKKSKRKSNKTKNVKRLRSRRNKK